MLKREVRRIIEYKTVRSADEDAGIGYGNSIQTYVRFKKFLPRCGFDVEME